MKSIIEDIPKWKPICVSPSHNPPSHINIPYGKQLRHVCPSCGKTQIIIPPQITF